MVLVLVIQSTIICTLSCVLMHSKAYVATSGNEINVLVLHMPWQRVQEGVAITEL